jgi:hypothetical protein
MQWWRQTFCNIKFVKRNIIYCFGKDLILLKSAIQRWDYIEGDKIKLLVVVKKTAPLGQAHILRNALRESISTSYMWDINENFLVAQDQPVQTCIIFYFNTVASLHLDAV